MPRSRRTILNKMDFSRPPEKHAAHVLARMQWPDSIAQSRVRWAVAADARRSDLGRRTGAEPGGGVSGEQAVPRLWLRRRARLPRA
jgi:hypothetical protein